MCIRDSAWLSAREITVATVPVRALRVSYIGESGWELHAENEHVPALFNALVNAGKPLGLGFFGAYAMNAMRLEKGYRAWGSDFTTERTPAETGAGFLIKPEGRSFTGKDALLARMASDERWEMVLMELKTQDVDPFYSHPVMHQSEAVGVVTSAAWGHRTGCALALAFLRTRGIRSDLSVEILGKPVAATVLDRPPFDPDNRRMKG